MGVLMIFHLRNFNSGVLFSQPELSYVLIKPEEYHRFDTEEVDKDDLSDESSRNSAEEEVDSENFDNAIKDPAPVNDSLNISNNSSEV